MYLQHIQQKIMTNLKQEIPFVEKAKNHSEVHTTCRLVDIDMGHRNRVCVKGHCCQLEFLEHEGNA